MDRYIKPFCRREPDGKLYDLSQDDLSTIPDKSGVYIIKSHGQRFIYPRSSSPVIYIGMSSNLKRRLRDHKTALCYLKEEPQKNRHEYWRYSRYQYFVSYGAEVFWFTTRGLQDQKSLESQLMEAFYDKYLAIPVGNGAISYR